MAQITRGQVTVVVSPPAKITRGQVTVVVSMPTGRVKKNPVLNFGYFPEAVQ